MRKRNDCPWLKIAEYCLSFIKENYHNSGNISKSVLKRVIESKESLPSSADTGKQGPSKTPHFSRCNKKCLHKTNPEGKQKWKKKEHKGKAKQSMPFLIRSRQCGLFQGWADIPHLIFSQRLKSKKGVTNLLSSPLHFESDWDLIRTFSAACGSHEASHTFLVYLDAQ